MIIDEIIETLSGQNGSLTDALLKTKVLLHSIKRKELVGWVNAELNGYDDADDVPSYRVVSARVLANVVGYNFTADSHPIPIGHLKDEEQEQLQSHKLMQPIGVLQSGKGQSIRPLPMEANRRLGEQLAHGVRINSAWCELNEQEIRSVVINVRSRLLDFILELRDAIGEDTKDNELGSKSQNVDATSLFNNAIFGPNATIVMGSGNAQVNVVVAAGDLRSLEDVLARVGLPEAEIEGLKGAIAEDKSHGRPPMDGEVGSWFTKLLAKSAQGTIKVGVDVVSSTVAKALTSYLSPGA